MPAPYKSLDQVKMEAMESDEFFIWLVHHKNDRDGLKNFLGLDSELTEKELDELQFLLKYGRGCVTAEEYLRVKKSFRGDVGGKGVWM